MELKLLNIQPDKFSHFAFHALQLGIMSAQTEKKEFFTPEMVLLPIICQKRFIKAIEPLETDIASAIVKLHQFVQNQDKLPKVKGAEVELSNNMAAILNKLNDLINNEENFYCDIVDLLQLIFDQEDSFAGYILKLLCNNDHDALFSALDRAYSDDCLESDVKPNQFDEDEYMAFDKDFKDLITKSFAKRLANKANAMVAKKAKGKKADIAEAVETDFESVGDEETSSLPLPFPLPKEVADMVNKHIKDAKKNANKSNDEDSDAPSFQGISITFGVGTSKMLDRLAGGMGPFSPNPGQKGKHKSRKEQEHEPWEDMVTCISDTYKYKNPLIGREEELERTVEILCRKDKNNPLYLGEPGVGKTALIYGLARKIDEGNVPTPLLEKRIYMLDMGALVAGASFHGEFEQRIKSIMEGCKHHGDCIIYIDEIHTMMGAGAVNGSSLDASNLLKPYLEDGSIRFIGCTTYQEYNRHMANSKSIVRRFQQIDIQEPSTEDAIEIVNGLIKNYERFHHVRYDSEAIRYTVEQSARLIADRFLPDKAIDIIDEAGAYRRTHLLYNKKGEPMSSGRQRIDKKVIDIILSKVCKINAKALTQSDNSELKNLEDRINSEIYGQDEAVKQVVRAVKVAKAGLTLGDKPLASLLFVGPTGVGKTEVCKVLAQELGIELVRFDMSEYTEKHTVAKLIGSPAGYVGYDDGGLLTDAIRKSPNCVLLLDEIEKAHSDIYNILLQVMDYAKLTDNRGNKVDFKNVILIMTSNAGAQYAGQASVGFSGGLSRGAAMLQTVKKTFKPEFLNRLSGTVVFHDMDRQMASLILDKKLRQLSDLLQKKNVTLELTPEAHDLLLTKGFTPQYGAREMDRVIQNLLTPILMDEILFGKLTKGGEAVVEVRGEELGLR